MSVSLKSSLYRIFLRGQQTSIISTRKSIIPDHFPQSHKVTPLKQAVLCWLCHLQCNQNLPTAAHGSQVPRKLYLWVADSDHFFTGYYWHPEQCHQRPMIIVCLRFSKMGRFGYWEQMSPNDLTNDEGGRKMGQSKHFQMENSMCLCLVIVLLVLNYSQQSSKVRAFQLHLWVKIDVCKLENIFRSMCVRKSRSPWVI